MKNERKEGIILKAIDYQDNSKILHVFTRNGKESLMVRGAKKMKSLYKGFVQTYNFISYDSSNAKIPTLIDGNVVDFNEEIKEDYNKCLKLASIIDLSYLINEPSEKFYEFFKASIKNINEYEDILYIYYTKMTYFFGVTPQFVCSCGNKDLIDFDVRNGIGKCQNCANHNNVELVDTFRKIYYMKYGDNIEIRMETKDALRGLLKRYYEFHIDRTIKF